jgi:O-antigen/teichoic acid export membrane protein
MSNDIGKKTRSSMYWNLSFKIPYEVFRFGVSIIVARLLDPKDFGIVSIATMIIFYSNTLTNLGFKSALVQRKEITDEHISSVFTADLTLSFFMACLFYFLAPAIAAFFHSPESVPVIRVMSLTFVITSFYDLPYTLFRRELNFKVITLVDTVKETFMSTITVVLAYLGFKYWSIVWGQLVPLTLAAIFLIVKIERKPALSFRYGALKDLFNYGIWSFVRSQLFFFSSRLDRLIVGRYLGPAVLGIYDKSKSLSQMPTESISSNINNVLYSSFSRIQDKKDELLNMLRKSIVLTSVINFPIFAGLFAIAPHFVPVVLGEKWNPMIIPLKIMCISGICASFSGLFLTAAVNIGNYRKYTIRLMIATGLLFILWLILVRWGIVAVALGAVVYALVTFFIGIGIVREKIPLLWRDFASCIVPALIGCVVMLLCVKSIYALFITRYTLINLMAIVLAGALTYAAVMLLIPGNALESLRSSLKRDLNAAWTKFKNTCTSSLSSS